MKFAPGDKKPKYGGRKKGTVNKKTQLAIDILTAADFEPLQYAIEQLELMEDPKERADIALKIADYIYPKRRAVDVSSDDGTLLSITDVVKLAADRGDV